MTKGHATCRGCGGPVYTPRSESGRPYYTCQDPDCEAEQYRRSQDAAEEVRFARFPAALRQALKK
jgi:hypothetical protein